MSFIEGATVLPRLMLYPVGVAIVEANTVFLVRVLVLVYIKIPINWKVGERYMNPFIDYLTFSIKPDASGGSPSVIDKDFIFRFLNLVESDFADIGRKSFYEHCYTSNNINIYQPYDDTAATQGWCVSMSGNGCRYYEQVQKDGNFVDFWREFFVRLRDLNTQGFRVNASRIDIAVDDYDGMLNMDAIASSANNREFVSQFRTAYEQGYNHILTGEGKGRTIYFGTRKSATLCRFYDKLMEQKQKNRNDLEKLKELEKIPHWIRMEFEFKREQAVKMVNIICDADNFGKYYAEVVNSYVRFVEPTDTNVTRCPMKSWWRKFIGTVRRAKLSVGQFKSFSYDRLVKYYDKYLATTVFTILSRMAPDEFFSRTYDSAVGRLKTKHNAIMNDVKCTYDLTPSQWWDFFNPVKYGERVAYGQ